MLKSVGEMPTPIKSEVKVGPLPTPSNLLMAADQGPGVWMQVAAIAVCAAFLLVSVFQMGLQAALAGRFYPGVTIAGQNIGGKTYAEARDALQPPAVTSQLAIKAGQNDYSLTLGQLGVEYDLAASLEAAYAVGRGEQLAIAGLTEAQHSGEQPYAVRIDEAKFNAALATVSGKSGSAPVNATVVIENGVPKIQADQDGLSIDQKILTQRVREQIARAELAPIKIEPSAQQAPVQAEALPPVVEKAKQLMATSIQLSAEGKRYTPSASDIGGWLVFDLKEADGRATIEPRVDEGKLRAYVQALAKRVDIAPVNKEINIQNGVTKSEKEGKDGKAIDQNAVFDQLRQAMSAQTAVSYEMPMRPVAFKTVYNRTTVLDAARYIEINLSMQRLWVYENQQVVYQTPITSGATNYGYGTSVGLFSIKAKATNTRLRGAQYGYNYDVPVDYWMPFNGGEGLHDAEWRSSFGGMDYRNTGSHGCVNLPDPAAAWIYNWATIGTPVWVHY